MSGMVVPSFDARSARTVADLVLGALAGVLREAAILVDLLGVVLDFVIGLAMAVSSGCEGSSAPTTASPRKGGREGISGSLKSATQSAAQ